MMIPYEELSQALDRYNARLRGEPVESTQPTASRPAADPREVVEAADEVDTADVVEAVDVVEAADVVEATDVVEAADDPAVAGVATDGDSTSPIDLADAISDDASQIEVEPEADGYEAEAAEVQQEDITQEVDLEEAEELSSGTEESR